MNVIVLTGGTLGGKTTIINNLKIRYKDKIIIIPEVTCLLFEKEFKRLEVWSLEWHYSLQKGILERQYELEEKAKDEARKNWVNLIVCDRGMLDPSAYLKDGLVELTHEFGINEKEVLSRYDQIIHLVSLSVLNQVLYEKFVSTNPHRIESIEEVKKQEEGTIKAWKNHPNRVILTGKINASMEKILDFYGADTISAPYIYIQFNSKLFKTISIFANSKVLNISTRVSQKKNYVNT